MLRLSRSSPLDVVSLLCGLVAFVLHVLGTVFPIWWIVHEKNIQTPELTFYYGIWVIIDCRNDSCITTSSRMHDDRAWLIGPAVLIVLADVLLLAVLVLTCLYLLHEKHGVVLRKLCVVLAGGAGGVIIMAVLIFVKKKAGLRPSKAPETSDGDPGWALYLSASAAVVAVINAVISSCGARQMSKTAGKKLRKTVFGIKAGELEIDVNALRRGELLFGKDINTLPTAKEELKPSSSYRNLSETEVHIL